MSFIEQVLLSCAEPFLMIENKNWFNRWDPPLDFHQGNFPSVVKVPLKILTVLELKLLPGVHGYWSHLNLQYIFFETTQGNTFPVNLLVYLHIQ